MSNRINSRAKGCRGEREAAKFLTSLGIGARRGQQFSGSKDSPDVVHELDRVHIEVKCVEGMDLGTELLAKACTQAEAECGDKRWVVLWRPNRKCWRLTFLMPGDGSLVTVTGPATITSCLQRLNQSSALNALGSSAQVDMKKRGE